MHKRIVSSFLVFICLLGSPKQAYGNSTHSISIKNNNVISIDSPDIKDNLRVLVEKDNLKYYYTLKSSKETIPLQLGKGNYNVKILKNVDGNKYKVVSKQMLELTEFNEKTAFLTSAQPIIWKEDGQAAKLAKELTENAKTEKEKMMAIYTYIVKNISYDFNKITGLSNDYVPNNDETLKSLSGICYDYSSLFASMLRSLNMPTKLIKGYKNDIDVYHAWNEVFIDGKWVIIDTTYDAAFVKANMAINVIKSNNEYNKMREY